MTSLMLFFLTCVVISLNNFVMSVIFVISIPLRQTSMLNPSVFLSQIIVVFLCEVIYIMMSHCSLFLLLFYFSLSPCAGHKL